MAKITLDSILSGFNLSKINSNFQKIQDELNNKVLYRDNPVGEPNTVQKDIDFNNKGLLNVSSLTINSSLTVGGLTVQQMVDTATNNVVAVTTTNASNAATSAANAAASATSSETSNQSSISYAALAQKWATQTSAEVVVGQGYGAKKYAQDAATSASAAAASAASVNDSNIVHKTGDETVAGIKTFTNDIKIVSVNGHYLSGMLNRMHNGDMRVDQRNNGSVVSTTNGTPINIYPVDRFRVYSEMISGTITAQRLGGDGPTGFSNYLRIKTTTAGSIAPNGPLYLTQGIEGYNVSDLAFGTSNASYVVVSFWYRSSIAGTHSGALKSGDVLRTYPFSFTVNSANTWEYKTVIIPGDTSGTWATDNTAGMYLVFNIGSGSSKLGTAGSWSASQVWGATGAVSILGTLNATIDITGVQLEAGIVYTPFERIDIGDVIRKCQRYFQRLPNSYCVFSGSITSGVMYYMQSPYIVPMRATPTTSNITSAGSTNMSLTSATGLLSSIQFAMSATATINNGTCQAGCDLYSDL